MRAPADTYRMGHRGRRRRRRTGDGLPLKENTFSIANAPERVAPLRIIMTALAKAGVHAGIGPRLEDGKLLFEHHPLLVVAERKCV
jgi:hypothetical protein